MYKILISDTLPDPAIGLMTKDERYQVLVKPGLDPESLKKIIGAYHALIVRSATKVTSDIINAAAHLKIIGRAGSGLDNIDVNYARDKGIEVINTPGSNSRAVAELTIGMMFALSRHLYPAISSMKNHVWAKAQLGGTEIRDKILGLVGFGKIGREVGRLAAGLGMRILVYKPNPVKKSPGYEFELVDLDTLLVKSDYVSLHLPKTDQTANLLTRREFTKMKDTAYLINCARGGIVNEQDLQAALDANRLAGAALDVYAEEPPQKFELIDHKKVLATPHIGGATRESQERVGIDIVTGIMNYLETKYVFIGGE